MRRRWFQAALAVVAGNVLYRLLMPHLPATARHQLFQIDLGWLLDCLLCALLYVLILWFDRE